MTRVPAARQVLVKNDVELRDHEGVAVSTLIMREEKAKQRTDLQTVRGGEALAAFLPPPEQQVVEEEAEPLHLRSHGTLCGGSFTTRKRTPFYAARHLNAKARGAVGRRRARRSQGRRRRRRRSDDDDDIDEPIVEEVDRPRCQAPPPPPPPQKPIVVDVTEPKAPVTTQDVRAAGGPPPQKAVWNSKDTWEERDVTAWAVSRFTELLQEEVCQVSPAINLKFRDVLRVVGDAQVVVFKGGRGTCLIFPRSSSRGPRRLRKAVPCSMEDVSSATRRRAPRRRIWSSRRPLRPLPMRRRPWATFCGGAARA